MKAADSSLEGCRVRGGFAWAGGAAWGAGGRAGFSLLEVLIALAIMALIAGGTVLMTIAAFRLGAHLEETGPVMRQQNAVLEALRDNLENLPGGTQLELRVGENGASTLYLHNCGAWAAGPGMSFARPVGAVSLSGPETDAKALVLHWHDVPPVPVPTANAGDEANAATASVATAGEGQTMMLGPVQAQVAVLGGLDFCQWRVGQIDSAGNLVWNTEFSPFVPAANLFAANQADGNGEQNAQAAPVTVNSFPRLLELSWSYLDSDEVERAVFPVHIVQVATPDAGSGEVGGGGGGGPGGDGNRAGEGPGPGEEGRGRGGERVGRPGGDGPGGGGNGGGRRSGRGGGGGRR